MRILKYLVLFFGVLGSISLWMGVVLNAQEQAQPQAQNDQVEGDSQFLNPANPSPFEAMPGEIVSEEFDASKLTDEEKLMRSQNLRSDEYWKNSDYKNYNKSFTELHHISPAFANNKYRIALAAYQSGVNSIVKMREKEEILRKESEENVRLSEKWYWQVADRKAGEERVINAMQRRAKLQAVTYFTRAIKNLDEVINNELREKRVFKRLLSAVYRNWSIYQFDLGNLPQCIPVLELYLQIGENEKEYPAHKYLSQCYSFQENILKKHKAGTEEQVFRFRYKKNVHLLRATELKHGKDSVEYKHIVSLLNRDEIVATQK